MGHYSIGEATAPPRQIAENASCWCSPIQSTKHFLCQRTKLAAFSVISLIAVLVGIGMIFGAGGFSWYSGAIILLIVLGGAGLIISGYWLRQDNTVRTPQPLKNVD